MPRGRPKGSGSKYTPELGELICARIGKGESLNAVAKDIGIPECTVRRWEQDQPEFATRYARAREERADFWADQIVQISDDGSNDTYELDDGSKKVEHDHIQRSRLRVDTRKWLMARMAPKRYGEFQRTELTGADGGALKIVVNFGEKPKP